MKNENSITVTNQEIEQRAHDIWEQSGRCDGQATEHWLRAERELEDERRQAGQVENAGRRSRTRNRAHTAVTADAS